MIEKKERLQRAALRARLWARGGWRAWLLAGWRSMWDGSLGLTVQYGQQPLFAVCWLLGFGAIGAVIFLGAWNASQFKPNDPGVLGSAAWYGCAQAAPPREFLARVGEGQLECFLRQPEALGYPEFNAGVYAFDVLLPVIDFEQQRHWIPDEDQWGGWFAKGWLYFEIVIGWLLSLLAVAGLSGLIRSD